MNTAISYNQLCNNLEATFEQVCSTHAPVLITRANGKNVVMIAQDDYLARLENAHFLKASESVLENIWDNVDDAEYDRL